MCVFAPVISVENFANVEQCRLLCEAVRTCLGSSKYNALHTKDDVDKLGSSIPWKEVSRIIARQNAYQFGPATCKKKFVNILEEGHVKANRRQVSLQALRQSAASRAHL